MYDECLFALWLRVDFTLQQRTKSVSKVQKLPMEKTKGEKVTDNVSCRFWIIFGILWFILCVCITFKTILDDNFYGKIDVSIEEIAKLQKENTEKLNYLVERNKITDVEIQKLLNDTSIGSLDKNVIDCLVNNCI